MEQTAYIILFALVNARIFAATNETLVADYMPSLNGHYWPQMPVTTYGDWDRKILFLIRQQKTFVLFIQLSNRGYVPMANITAFGFIAFFNGMAWLFKWIKVFRRYGFNI